MSVKPLFSELFMSFVDSLVKVLRNIGVKLFQLGLVSEIGIKFKL